MGKKKKNKKELIVELIEQPEEFLLSKRMGISQSTMLVNLKPENLNQGNNIKYFETSYRGWYRNFEFKKTIKNKNGK